MKINRRLASNPTLLIALPLLWACGPGQDSPTGNTNVIDIDSDDIAGVVRSDAGVEAGVWVVAETDDFDTFFARIVATDDEGRYLIPDLPDADYLIWVRGYGLMDSPKVPAWIWALITQGAPSSRATVHTSSGVDATRPLGTETP